MERRKPIKCDTSWYPLYYDEECEPADKEVCNMKWDEDFFRDRDREEYERRIKRQIDEWITGGRGQ